MNCYEHTLIAKQELPEEQLKTLINKYEDFELVGYDPHPLIKGKVSI